MNPVYTAAQLEQFRRNAKRLARDSSVPLHQAQDQLAAQLGFQNWSLLAKHSSKPAATPLPRLLAAPPTAPMRPRDPRTRYYLHGDQHEDDPTKYYCARCDVFFDAEHLASEHQPDSLDRCLDAIDGWKKRPADFHTRWRRPDDAVNCLVGPARAARAEFEDLRAPFHAWLLDQKARTDRIGMFARVHITKRGLPKSARSLPQLSKHLARRSAWGAPPEALMAAWGEFRAQAPGRSG